MKLMKYNKEGKCFILKIFSRFVRLGNELLSSVKLGHSVRICFIETFAK